MSRRWSAAVLVVILALSAAVPRAARAQDTNNPDELKKQLSDALNQLKAAQDRKNELSTENEKLKARVAELEQQLQSMKKDSAEQAAKTWALRSQAAALETFLQRYPQLAERWKLFLE